MADKQFVGSTRVKTTKYGQIINLGLNEKDLNLLKSKMNDRGWVNIDLKSKKDGGFYAEIPTMEFKGASATNAQDDDLF
jgi:hypothetical protein